MRCWQWSSDLSHDLAQVVSLWPSKTFASLGPWVTEVEGKQSASDDYSFSSPYVAVITRNLTAEEAKASGNILKYFHRSCRENPQTLPRLAAFHSFLLVCAHHNVPSRIDLPSNGAAELLLFLLRPFVTLCE